MRLLVVEDLYLHVALHQVRELGRVPRGAHHVVVYPVVVATAGLSHQQRVVQEPLLAQPRFGDSPVVFGPRGEEAYLVTLVEPAVDCLHGIEVGLCDRHPLRLLVGNVLSHRTVYVDEVVLDVLGQDRAR